VFEGDTMLKPASEMIGAAGTADIEQVVPMTAVMVGSAAMAVAADVPPSWLHIESSLLNSTA
jgi:hypothetical protein